MELFYVVLFMAAAATAGVLEWTKGREVDGGDENKEFQRFRHNYVLVYGLMMGGTPLHATCIKLLLLAEPAVLCVASLAERLCMCCNASIWLFCCKQWQTHMPAVQSKAILRAMVMHCCLSGLASQILLDIVLTRTSAHATFDMMHLQCCICTRFPACTGRASIKRHIQPVSPAGLSTLNPCVAHFAAGDWLQGPYVYALYQHYNFDRAEIGRQAQCLGHQLGLVTI